MAIFFFAGSGQHPAGQQQEVSEEQLILPDVPAEAEVSFQPSADPYNEYILALNDNKPVVVEFYARW